MLNSWPESVLWLSACRSDRQQNYTGCK